MVVSAVSYITLPVRAVISGLSDLAERIKQVAMRALDSIRKWIWGEGEVASNKRSPRAVIFYCAALLFAVKVLREGNLPQSALAISWAKTQLETEISLRAFLKQGGMCCVKHRPLEQTSRIGGTIMEGEKLEFQAQLEGQIAATLESQDGVGFVVRTQDKAFPVGYSAPNRTWFLWEISAKRQPIPEPIFFDETRDLKRDILDRVSASTAYIPFVIEESV